MKIDMLGNHPERIAELALLHFNEWKHLSPDVTLDDRIRKLQQMAQSREIPFIVVAMENDQLAGSAALVGEDMRTRKDLSPWLASVFVKPELRQNGLGTRLVRHIEDEAGRLGVEKLFLFTEHARDLYLKLGWRDLEKCEYQGFDVTVMFRELSGR